MSHSISLSATQKQNLNLSLKMWLPMLQASLQDLDTYLTNVSYENPFLDVKKPKEFYSNFSSSSSSGEFIESLAFYHTSLNDKLSDQIDDDTYQVQVVAWYDNEYGYTCQMVRTASYLMEISE